MQQSPGFCEGLMLFKRLSEDLDAFIARDPAARSRLEVVLCYPGLHALLAHRLAHKLWQKHFFLPARVISVVSRFLTGVEIHPGARIGRRCVIDHGQGVVIGETTEIGDDVTLYQGVTLGGIAPSVDSRNQVSVKRHPTLENDVILGSGAQVLGPITVGRGARVGANSVVTRDLPPGVTAVGIPAHAVAPRDRREPARFSAYGTPANGCPDPVLACIENLQGQVMVLVERIGELERRLEAAEAETNEPRSIGSTMHGSQHEAPALVAVGKGDCI
jgi:serine O-acetyltransferase